MKKQPTAPPPVGSRALRLYLYATAAVTGAAVMVIEILGAKMLAPYFGTSHFVWTAQIAVTLVALSIGYYAGGRWADRAPRPGRVYAAILGAAVYLGLTVRIVEPVAYWCLEAQHLARGSLLASLFLFFVPLALLAITGPFFVRVLTVAVAGVGGNVGRLSAISTAGSFAGTVLIGYVLIPFLRNSVTMFLTAAALMAVALLYFVVWGRRGGQVAAVAAIVAGSFLGVDGIRADARPRAPGVAELYRANSNFGQLQVVEDVGSEDHRSYLNDFLTQNTYDPATKQSTSLFSFMLHDLARAYAPRLDDALCIGMGVGIVPMKLAGEGARVDVVEINPAVVPVATRFFDFDPARVNVVIGDGRQYVNATANRYDAIVLDAFLGDSSPSHLMSREAFAAMRRALRPGGVLVMNTFCEFEPGQDYFAGSLDKTLRSVFASVVIHASGNGNVFFVASDTKDLRPHGEPDFEAVHACCRDEARKAFETIRHPRPEAGIVLIDDYNPIEYYDAANREQYRLWTAMAMQRK